MDQGVVGRCPLCTFSTQTLFLWKKVLERCETTSTDWKQSGPSRSTVSKAAVFMRHSIGSVSSAQTQLFLSEINNWSSPTDDTDPPKALTFFSFMFDKILSERRDGLLAGNTHPPHPVNY